MMQMQRQHKTTFLDLIDLDELDDKREGKDGRESWANCTG